MGLPLYTYTSERMVILPVRIDASDVICEQIDDALHEVGSISGRIFRPDEIVLTFTNDTRSEEQLFLAIRSKLEPFSQYLRSTL